MINLKFLKNKSVLITGGTGSIGSALVKYLIKTNCKVIRVMTNDENGLYQLSRDLNLSSFAFNNFSSSSTRSEIVLVPILYSSFKLFNEVLIDLIIIVFELIWDSLIL